MYARWQVPQNPPQIENDVVAEDVRIRKGVIPHWVDFIMVFRDSQSILSLEVDKGVAVYPLPVHNIM